MVLFDFECPDCNTVKEHLINDPDEVVRCSCGATKRKLFTTRGGGLDWFKPGWWRDIASEPLYIESKRHLKQECEKHGGYSVALLNENKGTGVSQVIRGDNERAWRKAKERRQTEEIVNEAYRRSFGDT